MVKSAFLCFCCPWTRHSGLLLCDAYLAAAGSETGGVNHDGPHDSETGGVIHDGADRNAPASDGTDAGVTGMFWAHP